MLVWTLPTLSTVIPLPSPHLPEKPTPSSSPASLSSIPREEIVVNARVLTRLPHTHYYSYPMSLFTSFEGGLAEKAKANSSLPMDNYRLVWMGELEYLPLDGKEKKKVYPLLSLKRKKKRCNVSVSFSTGRLISVGRMQWSTLHSWRNMHILKNNADAEGTPRPTDERTSFWNSGSTLNVKGIIKVYQ